MELASQFLPSLPTKITSPHLTNPHSNYQIQRYLDGFPAVRTWRANWTPFGLADMVRHCQFDRRTNLPFSHRPTRLPRFLSPEPVMSLSHFSEDGASRLVHVGAKPVTQRLARASARVVMLPETLQLILNKQLAKGDVFEVARLAGIMAAKRTSDLIPLCHSLPLDGVELHFEIEGETTVRLEALAETQSKTGVEMEALTAAAVAALTLYDMCKGVDRSMFIQHVQLEEKRGGKSGHYLRQLEIQTGQGDNCED